MLVFVYQNSGLFLRLYGVLRRAFVYTDVKTTWNLDTNRAKYTTVWEISQNSVIVKKKKKKKKKKKTHAAIQIK